MQTWKSCGLNANLHFPEPNPFIPTDFELHPFESDPKSYPGIIHDTPIMRVWFKQDTEFCKPKTIMHFDFTSPMAYADPLNCNLTHMFVSLFKDQLNEYLYDAELAGLRFGVSNTSNGISLSISGYSHKQQVLLSKVIDQMFDFSFCPKRFEIIKEQLYRSLKNFNAEQPYQHAVYYLALILTEHAWTKQELVDAVSCECDPPALNFCRVDKSVNQPVSSRLPPASDHRGALGAVHQGFPIAHACRVPDPWQRKQAAGAAFVQYRRAKAANDQCQNAAVAVAAAAAQARI